MSLKLYQRGKVWHFRGTVAGRRLRGSTGTEDKKRAERIKAEAESQAWKGHLDGPGAGLTMAQAAIAYRQAGKPDRFLPKIEDHWKDTPVRKITGEAIRQAARKLYPDAAAATWNRQVIVPTQAIINHSAELGWCPHLKVKRFDVTPTPKEPVTLEWVTAFAAHASPHLGALCLFMFGTGARSGEAVRMTWGDVDLTARTAKLSGNKPKPWTRTAHLPPPVVVALANIPSNRCPDEAVFSYAESGNVKKVWDNVIARAGIKRLTPHCCRHGFATGMLHKGMDIATVADRGGWKDRATLIKVYAHAQADKTLTDALFDTNLAQGDTGKTVNHGTKRQKQ